MLRSLWIMNYSLQVLCYDLRDYRLQESELKYRFCAFKMSTLIAHFNEFFLSKTSNIYILGTYPCMIHVTSY